MAVKLLILGLRRSGTTIFWQIFRQDARFVCFDEPFNPHWHVLPERGLHKNPEELALLVRRDPMAFWMKFSPIHFSEELREGLSDRQREYFRFLADAGENVVMDLTRCQFKVRALHELAPEAVLVHLYRPATAHATSHMVPSGSDARARLRKAVRRSDFWSRPDRFNGWSLESIVGTSRQSLFGCRIREIGLDPAEVYQLPAVGKLMAFWRLNFERIEKDGRETYGKCFISQNFEEFARDPEKVVRAVYARIGLSMPALDFSRLHPPNPAYDADSERWQEMAAKVGLLEGSP